MPFFPGPPVVRDARTHTRLHRARATYISRLGIGLDVIASHSSPHPLRLIPSDLRVSTTVLLCGVTLRSPPTGDASQRHLGGRAEHRRFHAGRRGGLRRARAGHDGAGANVGRSCGPESCVILPPFCTEAAAAPGRPRCLISLLSSCTATSLRHAWVVMSTNEQSCRNKIVLDGCVFFVDDGRVP